MLEVEGKNPRQTDTGNDIFIVILCILTWVFGVILS